MCYLPGLDAMKIVHKGCTDVCRRVKVVEEGVGVNEGFYTFYQRSPQRRASSLNRQPRIVATKWSQRWRSLYGSSQAIPRRRKPAVSVSWPVLCSQQ